MVTKEYLQYLQDTFQLSQDINEFTALCKKVNEIKPQVIMEIGVQQGGSLQAWLNIAKSLVIGIDIVDNVKWSKLTFNIDLHFIRNNSNSEQSKEEVLNILKFHNHKSIDFLFIDGDHTYEGVKKDYELYSPLVRRGGIIAFHDTHVRHGVQQYWNELKAKNKIDLYNTLGTGIIYKG